MAKTKEEILSEQWEDAWNHLQPIRSTWDEKEKALLAQANDSGSGNVTYARVTDAALSTLAFERQARVAAQLPTGRVMAASKSKEAAAKMLNVALNRYILKNADSQFRIPVKLRLWGVYASVYGSMPMFYDYRVDDRYIGPDCWLLDPRNFAIQPGFSNVQDADYAFISNVVSIKFLKDILKRDKTTWDKKTVKKVLKQAEDEKTKPSKDNDSQKQGVAEQQRYDKSQAKGRIELITKYESGEDGRWVTFAPDFDNTILRDIPNPHKSGRIPVVMRDCFPLMNSIFGLGDYERGMRIQKAKDSLTNLALEGAKNRVFPPLKIDTSKVTASTIKNQANARWIVQDMRGAEPVSYGNSAMSEYQAVWGSLQSMLMNQFGTTDTSQSQNDTGNPAYGKTPQALQLLQQRQNARDTWDMFMHEQATQELFEGMLNLLTVKMEKPINFSVFEEDIRQIEDEFGEKDGLEIFKDKKQGKMTLNKKQVASSDGYEYLIDPNSSMSQNAQEQFQALNEVWKITNGDPNLVVMLQQGGYEYDVAEHLKSMFVAAGVSDWDKILKERDANSKPIQPQEQPIPQQQIPQQPIPPEIMAQMQPQMMQPQQIPQAPMSPVDQLLNDPEIGPLVSQVLQ